MFPFHIEGQSRASDKTCFYLRDLNIMLDCGVETKHIPDHIFVTHGHSDHSSNIPKILLELGNAQNTSVRIHPIFYVPVEIKSLVEDYIRAFYSLSKFNNNSKIHSRYTIHPVVPGETLYLVIKNRRFEISIIKCYHSVPCVGYGFTEIKQKLKEEYLKLPSSEIGILKKSGVEITREVKTPLFCYLGDTSDAILQDDKILEYPNIMIECTFLEEDEIPLAKKKKHIALPMLKPFIEKHATHKFILYHFSKRYLMDDVKKKITFSNVCVWDGKLK